MRSPVMARRTNTHVNYDSPCRFTGTERKLFQCGPRARQTVTNNRKFKCFDEELGHHDMWPALHTSASYTLPRYVMISLHY